MVEFNLTTTSYNNLNPMALHQYVTVEQCKDFVASTTRTNYLLMGLLLLLGIAMLVWINRDKISFFKNLKEKKEMIDLMSNKETLEELGKQFGTFMKGGEPHAPEGDSGEIKISEGDDDRRRNVSESNDSGNNPDNSSGVSVVQDDRNDK